MALTYTNTIVYETVPTYTSTYLPCCNAPIAIDYQPKHIQEIYYAPEPPPQIQVVRQRLPDPPPDVIDRVVVVPQPKQYVYQVVEVPSKPPPVVQQRVVHQPPNAPLCGGTYRVPVPPKSGATATQIVQPSTTIQHPPPVGIQTSSSTIHQQPVVIQTSPSYPSTSFVQHSPFAYTTSPLITI